MGLLVRRQGGIRFMGQELGKRQPYEIARLGLGYVPEERRIFTELTVRENLLTGQQASRVWPDDTPGLNWTFESVFDLFPPLAQMQQRQAGTKIGRASRRERVCQYVYISVVSVSVNTKTTKQKKL